MEHRLWPVIRLARAPDRGDPDCRPPRSSAGRRRAPDRRRPAVPNHISSRGVVRSRPRVASLESLSRAPPRPGPHRRTHPARVVQRRISCAETPLLVTRSAQSV